MHRETDGEHTYRWIFRMSGPNDTTPGKPTGPIRTDPLMRQVIIHGAKIQGMGKLYSSREKKRQNRSEVVDQGSAEAEVEEEGEGEDDQLMRLFETAQGHDHAGTEDSVMEDQETLFLESSESVNTHSHSRMERDARDSRALLRDQVNHTARSDVARGQNTSQPSQQSAMTDLIPRRRTAAINNVRGPTKRQRENVTMAQIARDHRGQVQPRGSSVRDRYARNNRNRSGDIHRGRESQRSRHRQRTDLPTTSDRNRRSGSGFGGLGRRAA
ncbi:hypothetical protein VD0002_g8450 [Verticillium dahliae]|nr:hypothetical protein VdG2_00141 [Verticillium dahliae VDG2]KAF3353362.1 Putative beta-glucosidase btgE [Verticillium dahliae VDG1]PNH29403.1 hypothetical protein BJF96_g7395 [Verticillium dahliae]PNH39912.1 hypothetical protein VD0004_g7038 [Verticillium dahliae]PNH47180.1 hypothetical protein VD0003_g8869 [Verticillium dahliae]